MIKSLLLGTILGGLAAFIWSSISWELIGWHEKSLLSFQNEDDVSAVIASHTMKSGTYILPYGPPREGLTAEQLKAAEASVMEKMQRGPVAFAAVRRQGFGSFTRGLIAQALIMIAGAFLLTWLLLQTSGLSYTRRVIFIGVGGLAASVIVDLPNWNWWGFSIGYTVVNLMDGAITWLLAGLVIAKVVQSRTT